MSSIQYLNNATHFPSYKFQQSFGYDGYDHATNYEKIHQLEPQSEQYITQIQETHRNRQSKLYITNIICIFVICIFLYLVWHFTKYVLRYKFFFGTGIFFLVCYFFRYQLSLLMGMLMLVPLTVIDAVPAGCVKIENGDISCITDFY